MFFTATFVSVLSIAANTDCEALISPQLRQKLLTQAPEFRLPQRNEFNEEESACPVVAQDDFNFDGILDKAILLSNANDTVTRFFVAVAGKNEVWSLSELPSPTSHVKGAWVSAPLRDGYNKEYVRFERDADGHETRREYHDAKCVEVGGQEKMIRIYCFEGGAWAEVKEFSIDGPCESKLPASLVTTLLQRESNLHALRVRDLDPLFVAESGCYSVATGDYDGDGKADYATFLIDARDAHPKLFAALARKGGWSIQTLPVYTERAVDGFLATGRAETLVHAEAYEFDPAGKPFWLPRMVPKNAILLCGQIESGSYAFAYVKGKWHGVHISD